MTGCSTGFGAALAAAIIDLVATAEPPRQLALGVWGLDAVTQKLTARSAEVERWRAVGAGTDFLS